MFAKGGGGFKWYEPIMRALCLQVEGAAPRPTPPPPGCFEGCHPFSAVRSFFKRLMRALCLQMGGLRPPQPPGAFYTRKSSKEHVV